MLNIRARLSRLVAQDLFRSLSVLVGGTAVAHILTAAVLPFSTRIYSPADFAVAAAFIGVVNILAVASCLRYEMAIPLAATESEAANLLFLSCGLAVIAGSGLALLFWAWPAIFSLLGQEALAPFGNLMAIATALTGAYLALQMWFVRVKAFSEIAGSRVGQSAIGAALQIGLGLLGLVPTGLLVGQGATAAAGSLLLGLRMTGRDHRAVWRHVSVASLIRAAISHVRFPRFSVLEALANAASIYAPVLLITALAPGSTAGFLALATFVLQAPMALIGNSIQQVFVATAPQRARDGQLLEYVIEMLGTLARFSAAPLIALAIAGPPLFAVLFGSEWRPAGVLVAWMMPWFFMQFLASPVSTALHIGGRQGVAMVLQLAGLVMRLSAVAVAAALASTHVAEAYAISGFVFYGLYLAVILWSMKAPLRAILPVAKAALLSAAVGTAFGVSGMVVLSKVLVLIAQ